MPRMTRTRHRSRARATGPGPCLVATLVLLALALGFPASDAQAAIWPSAARRLERELGSSDPALRQAAVAAAAELPRASARRLLLRALEDPDSAVSSSALELLLRLETPGVTERVVPWLSGSDKRLRLSAALALGVAPAPNANAALARALADSDPEVRAAAAAALGASRSADAVLPLLGHLDDSVAEVRQAVIDSLGTLGDARAVLPLIGKIEDPRPLVRAAVAQALGRLHDARSSSALLLALRDPDREVVTAVVRALGLLGDESAVPALSSLLASEPTPEARRSLLLALGRIGSAAAASTLLRELAFDEPGREREMVLAALSAAPSSLTPRLRQCLDEATQPGLAEGCALGLAELADATSYARVRAALDRGQLSAKIGLLVLGRLGDSRALAAALERLTVADAETRAAAMDAADRLLDPAQADGRAVEPLARALVARVISRPERLRLVGLLGRTGSERALSTLLPLLESAVDPVLSERAASALGYVPGKAAGEALLAALTSEEPRVRAAAALALRHAQNPDVLGALLTRFERAGRGERALLASALFGSLAKSQDATQLARALGLLRDARGAEREPILEALARSAQASVRQGLLSLASSPDVADRRKIAELLSEFPQVGVLARLARDGDASVRANAVWSLGFVEGGGAGAARAELARALGDRELAVAGNAAVSLGRLLRGQPEQAAGVLCAGLLRDERSLLREQALRGLLLARAVCADGAPARLLMSDPRARVRRAAAELLLVTGQAADRQLLLRCQESDRHAQVADACGGKPRQERLEGEPVTLLILPSTGGEPVPAAPFAVLWPDGSLRLGAADRRGGLHEPRAPRGSIELLPFPGGD